MIPEKKINVLVVDDSALMRKLISDILNDHPEINVIGTAMNGSMALAKLEKLKPDVITLDVEMPIMNGIETLKEIQRINPTPVIMISSLTKAGAEITIQALELGAVDFLSKPDPDIKARLNLDSIKDELTAKVLMAANVIQQKIKEPLPLQPVNFSVPIFKKSAIPSKTKTVVIGSSTGGPQALKQIIPFLQEDFPAKILIIQHMPPKFTDLLAQRLNKISKIKVREAKDGDNIKIGEALVAPGDYHMTINSSGNIKLNQEPSLWGVRPAIDFTLASAANFFKEDLICVILTGMGRDGTQGSKVVKDFGGYCIAEDQSTSIIYGMPKCVIEAGYADKVVPLHNMANTINELIYK